MLPVRDARQQDLVEVAQHGGERLGLLGRGGWQPRADLAGRDLRQHRQLAHALEVARGPVQRGGAVGPQVGQLGPSRFGAHVGHAMSAAVHLSAIEHLELDPGGLQPPAQRIAHGHRRSELPGALWQLVEGQAQRRLGQHL